MQAQVTEETQAKSVVGKKTYIQQQGAHLNGRDRKAGNRQVPSLNTAVLMDASIKPALLMRLNFS